MANSGFVVGGGYSHVLVDTVKTRENVRAVSRCPSGAVTGGRGFLRLWSSKEAKVTDLMTWDASVTVTSLAVVADTDVWTGLAKGDILIFDLRTRDVRKKPFFGHKDGVTCIQATSPSFPSSSSSSSSSLSTMAEASSLSSMNLVISGGSDFLVKLWSSEGEQLGAYSGHANHIHCLATKMLSESSLLVLSGSAHGAMLATLLERHGGGYSPRTEPLPLPASAKAVTTMLEHNGMLWIGYDHGLLRICRHEIDAAHALYDDGDANDGNFGVEVELQAHAGRISSIQGIGNAVWTGSADHRIIAWDARRLGTKLFDFGDQGAFVSCMARVDWMMWVFLKDRALFFTSKSLFDSLKDREDVLVEESKKLQESLDETKQALAAEEENRRADVTMLEEKARGSESRVRELELALEKGERERIAEEEIHNEQVAALQTQSTVAAEQQASKINDAYAEMHGIAKDFDDFIKDTVQEHQKNVDCMARVYEIASAEASDEVMHLKKLLEELNSYREQVSTTRRDTDELTRRLDKKTRQLKELTTAAANTQSESAESLTRRDERIDELEESLAKIEKERAAAAALSETRAVALTTKEEELRAALETGDALQARVAALEKTIEEGNASREEIACRNTTLGDEMDALKRAKERDEAALQKKVDDLTKAEHELRKRAETLETQVENERSENVTLTARERSMSVAKMNTETEAKEREKHLEEKLVEKEAKLKDEADRRRGLESELAAIHAQATQCEADLSDERMKLKEERDTRSNLESQLEELRTRAIQRETEFANEKQGLEQEATTRSSLEAELAEMRARATQRDGELSDERSKLEEEAHNRSRLETELAEVRARAIQRESELVDKVKAAEDAGTAATRAADERCEIELQKYQAELAAKTREAEEASAKESLEHESRVKSLQDELDTSNSEHAALRQEYDVLDAQMKDALQNSNSAMQSLESNIADLQTTLASAQNESAGLRDQLASEEERAMGLQSQVKALKDDLDSASLEKDSLLGTLKTLDKESASAKASLEEAQAALRTANENLESSTKEKNTALESLSTLQEKLQALSDAERQATRRLEDSEAEMRHLQRNLQDMNEQRDRERHDTASLQEQLRAAVSEKDRLQYRMDGLEKDVQSGKVELQASQARFDEAKRNFESFSRDLERRHEDELRTKERAQQTAIDALNLQREKDVAELKADFDVMKGERDACATHLENSQRELNAALGDRYKLSQKLRKCLNEMHAFSDAKEKAALENLIAIQAKLRQSRLDYKMALHEGRARDAKLVTVTKENERLAQQLTSTTKSLNFFRQENTLHEASIASLETDVQTLTKRNVQMKALLQQSVKDIRMKSASIDELNHAVALLDKKLKRFQVTEKKVLSEVRNMNETMIVQQRQTNEEISERLRVQQEEMHESIRGELSKQKHQQQQQQQRLLHELQLEKQQHEHEQQQRRVASAGTSRSDGQMATADGGGRQQVRAGERMNSAIAAAAPAAGMSFEEVMASASKRPRSAVVDSYARRKADDRYK